MATHHAREVPFAFGGWGTAWACVVCRVSCVVYWPMRRAGRGHRQGFTPDATVQVYEIGV